MNESTIFQYSDIFLAYLQNGDSLRSYKNCHHCLKYVYSGEIVLEDGARTITVHGGEAVFIRRDHRVQITKQPYKGEQFKGITMVFEREFLRNLYQEERKTNDCFPNVKDGFSQSVIKLPKRPQLESLFLSITPYFDSSEQLSPKLADLKVREGVIDLLDMNRRFYPVLFDFADPWKIDLMDFMENNYTSDLTIEEYANYTGRSLATFKRDFKKISDLPPQKWLILKRLEKAHELLSTEHGRVEDVCYSVGFKNRSHFTTLFKKQYGVSPASVGGVG